MSAKSQKNQDQRHSFFEMLRSFCTYFSRDVVSGTHSPISDVAHAQRPIVSQQDQSSNERLNTWTYWNKNKEELENRYGPPQMGKHPTKQRIPRYYSINKNHTLLIILQGDITRTKVDAIVNAANEHMTGGSGVDGMVHRAAGHELYDACVAHKKLKNGARLPTGHCRILLSYNMSSTTYYIINTAGPVYNRYAAEKCAERLSSCYKTALDLANLYDLESIGFTAISCGIFGYPADDGADVALQTVDDNADLMPVVVFVLWDDHIYDAWIKKAKELNFIPFGPESAAIKNVAKPSIGHENEKQIDEQSNPDDDEQKSPSTLESHPEDLLTSKESEKTSGDTNEGLLKRPPSVPNDPPDTQQTDILEQNDNSMDVDNHLSTQKTIEMTSVGPEEEKSTAHDNSESSLADEEPKKSDETKLRTNDDDDDERESYIVQKETNTERAETKDEHHRSIVADNLSNQDRLKPNEQNIS